ncbi:MAG: tetratricopeptide repeat protein [Tannerellaceae bacterium]|jgi:tetratricopeptide (TPR) repeat protein|nr:tetratricopeptide repeat protein [Tannerellaceae bacterium]
MSIDTEDIRKWTEAIELDPKDAEAYFNRGVVYFRIGSYERAFADFNKSIELDPNNANAYCNRGIIYSLQGNHNQAIDCFNKAIELKPDFANVYFMRGNAYVGIKDYNKGIADFNKAIEINPNDAEAYDCRGNAYAETNDYYQAIVDYSRVIELRPNDAKTYRNRGYVYAKLEDYNQAIADSSKAIELSPNETVAFSNRGAAYAMTKNYMKAIVDYTKVIELNSINADAYFMRGNAYAETNDYYQAIEDYTKAIELNPNFAAVYGRRGLAYKRINDYSRAIEDYTKAIELNMDANMYYNRGLVCVETKNYHQAIADFSKAVELKPDFTYSYINRGNSYIEISDYPKAIADYSKVIELDPNEARAYYNRGNLYAIIKKDYPKAIADYSKAIELDPNEARAYYNRGQTNLEVPEESNRIQAIDDFSKVIELDPNNASAYNNRGLTHATLENYCEAIDDYSKVIELRPNDANAYYNRGFMYYLANRYAWAIADYDKAIELETEDSRRRFFWLGKGKALLKLDKSVDEVADCFFQSKDILRIIVFVNESPIRDDDRECIVRGGYLKKVVKYDPFFKEITKGIKEDDLEDYKDLYIHAAWLISQLCIKNEYEKTVAHYTSKETSLKMLRDESEFRLSVLKKSNDPKEGLTLLDYLFNGQYKEDIFRNEKYEAFAGCFTFNLDNLNQFRLYGKEKTEIKVGTGVSIAIKDSFFSREMKLLTSFAFLDAEKLIKDMPIEKEKFPLYRCIYMDPTTGFVASVGHREEYTFQFTNADKEKWNIYKDDIDGILNSVRTMLVDLKNKVDGLDREIAGKLLLNLCYFIKDVGFKEEQECRIVTVEQRPKVHVKSDNSDEQYINYAGIQHHVEKICFGPQAVDMESYQKTLKDKELTIMCECSKRPYKESYSVETH